MSESISGAVCGLIAGIFGPVVQKWLTQFRYASIFLTMFVLTYVGMFCAFSFYEGVQFAYDQILKNIFDPVMIFLSSGVGLFGILMAFFGSLQLDTSKEIEGSDNKQLGKNPAVEDESYLPGQWVLDFRAYSESPKIPRLFNARSPSWDAIKYSLTGIFEHGGIATLTVRHPKDAYVYSLEMRSMVGNYLLVALTRDPDPKNATLVWWDETIGPPRDNAVLDDHCRDGRMICTDINVALRLFRRMLDCDDQGRSLLSDMQPVCDSAV